MAVRIDAKMKTLLAEGGDEIAILGRMAEHMDDFKQLIDAAPRDGLDLLLTRFPGFLMYAKLLDLMADGIASGDMAVPPENLSRRDS